MQAMRHRLDQRQPVLTCADLAFEQRQEAVGGGARRAQMRLQPGQRAVVIVQQLTQPCWQSGEWQLVTGQHQLIPGREARQPRAAVDPVGDRIRQRLGRIDPQIGRD